jgi:hypothetical protein
MFRFADGKASQTLGDREEETNRRRATYSTASPVIAEQAQGALPGGFIPEALSQASGLATPSFFLGDRSLEDLFGRIVVWHRCIRLETFLAPLAVHALLTLVSAAPAA